MIRLESPTEEGRASKKKEQRSAKIPAEITMVEFSSSRSKEILEGFVILRWKNHIYE